MEMLNSTLDSAEVNSCKLQILNVQVGRREHRVFPKLMYNFKKIDHLNHTSIEQECFNPSVLETIHFCTVYNIAFS